MQSDASDKMVLPSLSTEIPCVLLENTQAQGAAAASHLFWEPIDVVVCTRAEEIDASFARIEAGRRVGLYAAGWFAYELGYYLDPALVLHARKLSPATPLLWFGLFRAHAALTPSELARWWRQQPVGATAAPGIDVPMLNMTRADYRAVLARIERYIEAGDTYQANFTLKYRLKLRDTREALYFALRENQPVEYAAYIRADTHTVMSFSPELFFRKTGTAILSKPMKGTAPRGRDSAHDSLLSEQLRTDAKSRAENLMIVDLLRNDFGRIAAGGTVKVPQLFEIERYRTLLQMTSTIAAQVDPDISLKSLIYNLFPCGSVTGAPKIRTMEIIRELEAEPRGVYTGAIGYVMPDNDMCFNVAIRTLVFDNAGNGEMGIGSGVVYDSSIDAEYDECLLKAKFLTAAQPAFALIETILWSAGRYCALDAHLERLRASADYFDFVYDETAIRTRLRDLAASFTVPHRVRLLLARDGGLSLEAAPVGADGARPWRLVLSPLAVDPDDPFVYHKTTNRAAREAELARLRARCECDEVVFVNTRGELTEGTRSNLVVQIDGKLVTPPVASGLLPGTFRRQLLAEGRVSERILTPADLRGAQKIFVCNAIRGLIEAQLIEAQSVEPGMAPAAPTIATLTRR